MPRLTGTDTWRHTTQEVRDALARLGYDVSEHGFEFSDWPARFGPPLVGLLVSAGLGGSWLALRVGLPVVALAVLVGVQAITVLLFVASERFLLRLPRGRRSGVNLLARSGPRPPRWLIVAHRDSKSQPVPIALRVLAAAVAGAVWTMLLAGAVLSIVDVHTPFTTAPVAVAGIVAGLVLLACTTGNASPGALDNATGVAALLGIAARERGTQDVAFLVTDAEEFGLAGASAIAGSVAWAEGVINLDGLDDCGPLQLLGRFGTPRRGGAPELERALLDAAADAGASVRTRPVPRGLMLDHIAFARAGIPALTVMRGTWLSMTRVHRPADHGGRLTGEGVVRTMDVVHRALDRLRSAGAPPPTTLDYPGKKIL